MPVCFSAAHGFDALLVLIPEPCDVLRRNIVAPARIRVQIVSKASLAGPSVTTIFAFAIYQHTVGNSIFMQSLRRLASALLMPIPALAKMALLERLFAYAYSRCGRGTHLRFLPVSSTAHLRIAQALLGMDLGNGSFWKMFVIVIQIGPILCLPIFFRNRLAVWFASFPGGRATTAPH